MSLVVLGREPMRELGRRGGLLRPGSSTVLAVRRWRYVIAMNEKSTLLLERTNDGLVQEIHEIEERAVYVEDEQSWLAKRLRLEWTSTRLCFASAYYLGSPAEEQLDQPMPESAVSLDIRDLKSMGAKGNGIVLRPWSGDEVEVPIAFDSRIARDVRTALADHQISRLANEDSEARVTRTTSLNADVWLWKDTTASASVLDPLFTFGALGGMALLGLAVAIQSPWAPMLLGVLMVMALLTQIHEVWNRVSVEAGGLRIETLRVRRRPEPGMESTDLLWRSSSRAFLPWTDITSIEVVPRGVEIHGARGQRISTVALGQRRQQELVDRTKASWTRAHEVREYPEAAEAMTKLRQSTLRKG